MKDRPREPDLEEDLKTTQPETVQPLRRNSEIVHHCEQEHCTSYTEKFQSQIASEEDFISHNEGTTRHHSQPVRVEVRASLVVLRTRRDS